MNQKAFRLVLARALINNITFRKRTFSSMPKYATVSKRGDDSRQKKVFNIPEEIQYGNVAQHFPEAIATYRRGYAAVLRKTSAPTFSATHVKSLYVWYLVSSNFIIKIN